MIAIRIPVILVALTVGSASHAEQRSATQVADELGGLLASEGFCDLSFEPGAIRRYVDDNLEPGEANFPSYLGTVIRIGERNNANLSPSAKVAHCHAVSRIARHYGFIE